MMRTARLLVAALACGLAAHAARAQESPSDLLTRIDRLEATIRNLTGSVEQLQYRDQQLEQQLLRLQAQLPGGVPAAVAPPRLGGPAPAAPAAVSAPPAPPAPTGAAAEPPQVAATAGRRGDAFDPTLHPTAPGAPRPLGASTAANEPPPPVSDAPGPARLGAPLDLSARQANAAPGAEPPSALPTNPGANAPLSATLPPSNTAKDTYDLAYGYVLHKDYALAADTFRLFLHEFPSDRLAPEALYWLGESLFQRQQYRDAAESFLSVSTKYETSPRAPEALLRLGQSLAALGEKEAACASLGEVLRKYPHAAASVKQTVEREQKRGHC